MTSAPNTLKMNIATHTKRTGYATRVLRRYMLQPASVAATLALAFILVVTLGANWIAPQDPYATSIALRMADIGTPHRLLGGDELGRDILSRVIYGGRVSLIMAFMPVMIGLLAGGGLGIIAGYAGGRANTAIMRCMDVFYAFPSILLAVAISGALGPGLTNAILSLSLIFIPPITRIAESVTTQVRSQEYVTAAQLSGASIWLILRRHVFSNVFGPIVVFASSQISVSIITASGLSFLGLGVSPPTADWGLMLSSLRQSIYVNPIVAAIPGVMIFICSICFNVISDGVRKAMEIRR